LKTTVNFTQLIYHSDIAQNPSPESLYRSVYMLVLILAELKGGKIL
jgi:hypothetical protein